MRRTLVFKFTLIPLGIALLFAGLFFDAGNAQSPLQATPAPTLDRLAEPTLPPQPTQADRGAQVYWLSCLPCHGDKGQGLTDEFRSTYPPEEQYCWERGCHGKLPYEDGFTIPMTIPAVIGPTTLGKFSNGLQLYGYIHQAMPFWKPGSLSEEDAWKVTAFVLRQNGLWSGTADLSEINAESVLIPRQMYAPTTVVPQKTEAQQKTGTVGWMILIGSLVVLIVLVFVLKKSRNTTTI